MRRENLHYYAMTGGAIAQMLSHQETREMGIRLAAQLTAQIEADDNRTQKAESAWVEKGPRLWKRIHERALYSATVDPRAEARFLAEIAGEINCPECRGHFIRFAESLARAKYADYFARTVAFHNEVNERLGKPIVTQGQARELYANAVL